LETTQNLEFGLLIYLRKGV